MGSSKSASTSFVFSGHPASSRLPVQLPMTRSFIGSRMYPSAINPLKQFFQPADCFRIVVTVEDELLSTRDGCQKHAAIYPLPTRQITVITKHRPATLRVKPLRHEPTPDTFAVSCCELKFAREVRERASASNSDGLGRVQRHVLCGDVEHI